MTRIVFTAKKQKEILRKYGKIYTVRLNNKKEGRVTIYFGRIKVARGLLRKVTDIVNSAVLEEHVHLSGYRNAREWSEKIDEIFLFKGGWVGEGWRGLALYEVSVTEWLENFLSRWEHAEGR